MTKVIKGEFENFKDVKVEDVLLTCDASLEVFNNEVSRLSRMDDDLFTYEVEVANIPCDSKMDNDSEQEADDDMGYDPSDVAFIEWLGSKNFNYKTMDHYTIKAIWIYWIKGDDENDWIYEWNKDVPWVDEKPWTNAGVWTKPTPVKHTCKPFNYKTGCSEWPTCSWKDDGYCNGGNLPGTYIIGNQLHYQDYEWYEALEDSELKDLALTNKDIMEGVINEDDNESRYEQKRRWNIYINYNDVYEINHRNNEREELCEIHELSVLPPRTAEEILARERERKARTTLLMALPEDHLAKFHKMTDAKEMWEAIKSRFGGNDESKKMQKYILKQQFEGFSVSNSEGLHKGYDRFQSLLSQLEIHWLLGVSMRMQSKIPLIFFLRSLPSAWSQVSLIMRTKPGVDSLNFDDLYNNLRVFESDVKGSTASSSSTQNLAFVSKNTSSTNDVSTAYGVSNSSGHKSQCEHPSSYSFLANQSSSPQLDHEDLE
ncbi:hypothetical protein Tco_0697223 [Tanacetum coccineum]